MPKRTNNKPGRPKGKPMSAKERAQRRAAAVKTGQYATTALGQALPPCKPAVCPNDSKGTCEVKQAVERILSTTTLADMVARQRDILERRISVPHDVLCDAPMPLLRILTD